MHAASLIVTILPSLVWAVTIPKIPSVCLTKTSSLNAPIPSPVCFNPEHPPPSSNYQTPNGTDCSWVADLFNDEDTRRTYELSSFGHNVHFKPAEVDFLLPMFKTHRSCHGGITMQEQFYDQKVWALMRDVAHNLEWLQQYCEDKGNLGGRWLSSNGFEYSIWGVLVDEADEAPRT